MKFVPEHLGLPARNPLALKDWYVRVLGAKLAFDNGQTPPAYLISFPGGFLLEIYQAESSLPETAKNSLAGWRHLALRVDSLEAAKAVLETSGVNFPDPMKPAGGGGRVVFFRDPEDNLLHLVERHADNKFKV